MTWSIAKSLEPVALMRGCSIRAWHQVASPDVTARAARSRVNRAIDDGLLRTSTVDGRKLCLVTERGFSQFLPHLPRAWAKTTGATERAAYWRTETWDAFLRAGYKVSNTASARYAVRRHLLDKLAATNDEDSKRRAKILRASPELAVSFLSSCKCGFAGVYDGQKDCPDCSKPLSAPRILETPAECEVCGHVSVSPRTIHMNGPRRCSGVTSASLPVTPYDVAYRKGHVVLLLIDSPYKALKTQIAALPLMLAGAQPPLDVVWVPTDGTYNRDELCVEFGRRTSSVLRALLPGRTPSEKARKGLLPRNTRLLPWLIVELPEELLGRMKTNDPKGYAAALSAAVANPPSAPLKKTRGRTAPAVIPLDEPVRERLLALRGTFGPNMTLRGFLAALLVNHLETTKTRQSTQTR